MQPQVEEYFSATADGRPGTGAMLVRFYYSEEYRCDMIEFRNPGDSYQNPHFRATEEYKLQYPREWAAYQAGESQVGDQTRLSSLAWLDEAAQEGMRGRGIITLEQLVEVDPGRLSAMNPSWGPLQERAKAFIKERNTVKPSQVRDLEAENKRLNDRIKALEEAGSKVAPAARGKRAAADKSGAEARL